MKPNSYVRLLTHYLRPHWRKALGLTLALLSSIGLQLVNPQIVRGFIDAAQAQAAPERLIYAALAFFGIGLLVQVLNLLSTYLSTEVGFRAPTALRADLARHCLALDMAFHNERTPGEMIERIDGDVTALSNFFSQFVIRLLGSGLLILGVLAALFREDWRVGLALTAFAVGSLLTLNRLRNVAVDDSTAERQALSEMFGFLEERLAGLDDIRANASGSYTLRRYFDHVRACFTTATKAFKGRTVAWRTTMLLFGLAQVMALGIGAWLFMQGRATLGAIYLMYHYTQMLFNPLEQIAHQIQDLQKAAAGIGRVRELMAKKAAICDGEVASLPEGALPLAFEDVSFHYEDDNELVLKDIAFALEPGRTLGLLGRTGSGKTTLTRLLFRLYEAGEGRIRLGGVALRDLKLDCLRRRVAMVTQEVQLFRATVRDNLTFFKPNVPDERIIAVLRDLGMGDWFDRLPQGLDTELKAGGEGLSAGEAQLLAFARAFLGDPGLVILDEPSSRLDPATEKLLERAMDRLLRGRTGIIIAHRLATVQRVDEIMIMDSGRIGEHGERRALVNDPCSHFSHLLATGMEEAFA